MVSQTIQRINGLLLGRTPSQSGELHVVKGRNFMPFLEGPRSYFGGDLISQSALSHNACHTAEFSHDGTSVYIDETGIYQLNDKCLLYRVFEFECEETEKEPCDFDYPWTHAYVGDSHFYSHPRFGLIEYDTFKKEWCQHSRQKLGFTDLIFGITQSNGSLIVQSRDTVTWSEFDQGANLIENEYTGAGSQSLHLAMGGRPLGVYSDGQGWFSFTSNGAMYSRPLSSAQILSGENIEASAVFRHDNFPLESVPFSPYSITNISPSLIAFLGNKGLMQVGRFDNNQFTSRTFAPVMSRWFREKLLKCSDDYLCNGFHRLFYSKERNWLFVSFAHDELRTYEESLVYDLELEEWGSFNRRHRMIMNFPRNARSNQQENIGWLTPEGYMFSFNERGMSETSPPFGMNLTTLDSFIDIGYIRPESETDTERQYSLEGFTIETNECQTNFKALCFAADGECDYDEICEPREPYKHSERNCANYYVCSNLGTVHIIRLTADEINESFWVTLIRLNLKERGKI